MPLIPERLGETIGMQISAMSEKSKNRITSRLMIFLVSACLLNIGGDIYLLKWPRGVIVIEGIICLVVLIALLKQWSEGRGFD